MHRLSFLPFYRYVYLVQIIAYARLFTNRKTNFDRICCKLLRFYGWSMPFRSHFIRMCVYAFYMYARTTKTAIYIFGTSFNWVTRYGLIRIYNANNHNSFFSILISFFQSGCRFSTIYSLLLRLLSLLPAYY